MTLQDLEIYQIALKISDLAWEIYKTLPKEFKYSTNQKFSNPTPNNQITFSKKSSIKHIVILELEMTICFVMV